MPRNFGVILGTVVFVLVLSFENGLVLGCSGGGGAKPNVECGANENPCNDGKKCYTDQQKCDEIQNCDDNTDEDNHHCGKNYDRFLNLTKLKYFTT